VSHPIAHLISLLLTSSLTSLIHCSYDASCLISFPNAGSSLASIALKTIPYPLPANTPFVPTAKHFFRKNADGTTNPVFKLTSTGSEFVGKKVNGVDAPKDP
jgi:hypothetical protein